MTVLVESYWREISGGLTEYGIPIQHFVLHADQATLRDRIDNDEKAAGPSTFCLAYLGPYAEPAQTWLHNEAEVIDTTHITAEQAAQQIAASVLGR
ncbi:hypothetical protein AB4Y72_19035 [Arthrobacter sp. YAF34]|uniref:hypothetical protein n=1 Tax=Arthrobacter sp. YAF34 TaxID=3233083 RepID=UPI003F8DF613